MAKPWLQEYRTDGQAGKRQGTGLWQVTSPNQNSAPATSVQLKPFNYARKLKIATDLLGQKRDVTWRHTSITGVQLTPYVKTPIAREWTASKSECIRNQLTMST
jgi:hypothetical protein